MPVDPLSTATRTAKRNLLVSSVLGISFRAFDVTIDKFPIGGVIFSFNERLFTFLLSISTMYFFVTFALYYFIDIKNFAETEHQRKSADHYREAINEYYIVYADKVAKRLKRLMSPDQALEFNAIYQHTMAKGSANPSILYSIKTQLAHPITVRDLGRDEQPELFKKIDRLLSKYMKAYQWHQRMHWMAQSLRFYATSTAYVVRNYFTDGLLPAFLGVFALFALYGLIPVRWLQHLAP